MMTDELASVRNLIERVRVAMVTTADPAGVLSCSPLQTLELDADARLWLFVAASASGVEELNRGYRRVCVTYSDPNKQDYASFSGSGAIVHDHGKMRAHWNAWVGLWFPLGIEDSDVTLLCVTVDEARYWEAPGSAYRQFHRQAGTPRNIPNAGEHAARSA